MGNEGLYIGILNPKHVYVILVVTVTKGYTQSIAWKIGMHGITSSNDGLSKRYRK